MFYAIFKSFVLLLSISCFSVTSFYGCELWDLACDRMDNFALHRGRVSGGYGIFHLIITGIPLLCKCLPVFDEVCRRSINFLRTCISHSPKGVRCVANYGIFHGRCDSCR